ncbi:GGDEF domain-containing protein [Massilia sp. TSP1-1-2]|uniref:GGDEF domain-containing protein n=1 Tax=Massilia sp. TSP1-1-2 TaxID=2804649 RepID=UPI003CEC561D
MPRFPRVAFPRVAFSRVDIPRLSILLAALGACTIVALYAGAGSAKPMAQWNMLDIAAEGSIALMACAWFVIVLRSRPQGRATTLLACGLAGLMLGTLAHCMDALFSVAVGQHWHHLVDSGITLAGMAGLTWGLLSWRKEQLRVSEHTQKREHLFRGHRSFDHLTQVADADYLRDQLSIAYASGKGDCSILMLDIDSFHLVNRDYGQREGDRVLQAVTHVLLLNLRSTDLLCRYAGDRFAVLLPHTPADIVQALGHQLRRAVGSLRHHTQHSGQPLMPTVRYTFRSVDAEPRQLLKELNRSLERRMPYQQGSDDASGVAVAI